MHRRKDRLAGHSLAIHGVGIDTVDLGHFSRTIKAHPALLRIAFTRREYRRYRFRLQSLAARLGVKEAFIKAAGGLEGIGWRDVETLGDSRGRPYVVLHGRASWWCQRLGIRQVLVSMSHSQTTAIAQVVLVRGQACLGCLKGNGPHG